MHLKIVLLLYLVKICSAQVYLIGNNRFNKMKEVFAWKQIGYNFDGIQYIKDEPVKKDYTSIYFRDSREEKDSYFTQYNNIPIGFEVYEKKLFITVPRRRYGIPSTLNYVDLDSKESSPLLKPYPNSASVDKFFSVYRPRVDACGRLWMVDTGLLEIPGDFQRNKKPEIIIIDLKTDEEILRYTIPDKVLVNGTTSGLTSITVDVTSSTCDDAFAYINDLAQNGLIVFSLKRKDSWRFEHPTFKYDVGATNFSVAGHNLNWKDGLFSIALSDPDSKGVRKAYYHPLMSTQEFSVSNEVLKNPDSVSDPKIAESFKLEGVRGAFSQSGSHDFHSGTKTLLFANVAQDSIMCWNTKVPLISKISVPVAQSHTKLVYISDLKVKEDDVWVLVNQIPTFIYSKYDTSKNNFFVHKGRVQDIIKTTLCDV
ncbi:L-dopachrome tautomerase yellow-f2 [Helicoverpa armigera]|uniref:L-dopachrome tautomerase yellow-f2 n=1 Tax=Helicoverpa armigera TaxID=29058 RepID=UPI003082C71F